MPKYYLHHSHIGEHYGKEYPWEIECSEETAEWIRAVLMHIDESCKNCSEYIELMDEETHKEYEEWDKELDEWAEKL